ncbi:MAG: redoxin domain-containing protein [Rubrivivax sp.]|nr:redoxin domain-containing protein [Rubrivivax sp.]
MITVLHEQRETALPAALAGGEDLWLTAAEVLAATGWAWKPEGLCRGDVCVPLPAAEGRADGTAAAGGQLVRGERLNLAALWRRTGQPVAHEAASGAWAFGTGAGQRGAGLGSLQAPDFELPDLEGRAHRLSDFRGRRVFVVTWASW